MSLKVLHLVSGNLYGGVEALLLTLAKQRALAPQMDPSFGVCFTGRLTETLEAAGTPPLLLGGVRVSRPWTVMRARRNLEQAISSTRPDATLCHGAWTLAVFGPVLREARVPFALFLHDVSRGRHWVDRWANLTSPDLVIANSNFTATSTTERFPGTKRAVYYCPVPARSDHRERGNVRAELGVGPEQVVILQASRMQPGKGQREHLACLAQLRALPDWVSVHAGGPQRRSEMPYFEGLKSLAARLGIAHRVKFLGDRTDVPRLLAGADVYFQPSSAVESFGIAFIEAMHAGLPIVTYAIGGPAEFVTGEVGFAAANNAGLVSGLGALISSPELRLKLGRNGQHKAHSLCDPAQQLPALAQVIERGLGVRLRSSNSAATGAWGNETG